MPPKIHMSESRVKGSCCPWCWTFLDCVSNVYSPDSPEPGDFTVCIHCGAVLKFNAEMQLTSSSLGEVPIQLRSKFAYVQMIVEQVKDSLNTGAKPWQKQ